ncbi:hypothetical protein TIFTF001_034972 [Ficus carica]|uniref:Uncharacterized protein n=1 Tax=Ficus carica TaxID=3494 RepID=A0AA88E3W8_FICCA|nr:hypothetical protein TIFTF001_034972 [Ficus carica]
MMAAKKVLAPMVAAFAVLLAAAAIADARADIFSIVMSKNQADSIPKFVKEYYKSSLASSDKKSDECGESEAISGLRNFLGRVSTPCDGVCRCLCYRVLSNPFPICKCAH